MGRVNLFLDDRLLNRIDEEARVEGTTRSALIASAMEKYIEGKRQDREEEKRKKMQEAARNIDKLARELGDWNAEGSIRKFRDGNLKSDS